MFKRLTALPLRASRGAATLALVCAALAGTAALSGCQQDQPSFNNLDITGNTQFGKDFSLPDTDGKLRTLADYRGKVVVLLFGYTHCPDVCPTTLAELAQSLNQLGPDVAKRVQVLFVSVDPKRDTDQVLSQYVSAFDPSFRALRPANDAQLKQVTNDFRITYEQVAGSKPDNYSMNHTAASVVFDPSGKLRLFARDGQGTPPWVHDLPLLLKGSDA
ncbi:MULTISPECIES: SCO family protein [Burkholderia]|uniref:SCO family protein n=1 Tax=Burkholderia gladioli TaxID=28095 RepID=A0A2A7SF68_BURGA|nr:MULTISPECIES: SCO family protein [Burkholderia]ATF90118.1 cytochrome c oxidase assembly protein [Burkholderia gladioli pv. gladioli]MBJ9660191.1 SCO family protein [Burkholderia gladioli]MBJ9711845.1 SCO family protein [Burkholderia gladioli]MBU9157049.1 SCO family protein [Burkholderia gladioli]MBU9167012.1 SCO family protein [Burkholderia gladioli]